MNKVLADILERPVPKGLTVTKVKSLIQDVAKLDEQPKLVYSSNGEKILGELNRYGAKDIPQNYRGVLLEHWLEILSQTQETITEAPRPTGPEATTLTSDRLENLGEYAEQRDAAIKQTRDKAVSDVANTQARLKEIYAEQQRIEREENLIAKLQPKFKDKVVNATVTVTDTVTLSAQDFETYTTLQQYATDTDTKTILIDDLATIIEDKIELSEDSGLASRIIAVDIVEALSDPEKQIESETLKKLQKKMVGN